MPLHQIQMPKFVKNYQKSHQQTNYARAFLTIHIKLKKIYNITCTNELILTALDTI